MTVIVQDQGIPKLVSPQVATIQINIVRNRFTPRFQEVSYSTTILQTLSTGNFVLTITAIDDDLMVRLLLINWHNYCQVKYVIIINSVLLLFSLFAEVFFR